MNTYNKSFHWAWIILAICFVNLFINYSVRLGYGLVLPEMIRALHLNRTAGGTIYNLYLFTYIILTPFTGFLTDRFGGRRVITACCIILGCGILLMGTTKTLWTACLFYAIAGVGATGMWTPVITLVQRWFSPHRRGLALGILSTGYGLGFATMGAVFPWIVNHFNWRFSWYFLGSGALLMVLVNGLLLRSDPEDIGVKPWGQKNGSPIIPDGHLKSSSHEGSLSMIFRSSTFWLVGLSYLSISYSLYGITTFMVDYATNQLGLPLEKASLLATVHGFSQVAGVLIIVPLSDYFGRKKTIIMSQAFIMTCLIGIIIIGKSWGILAILLGLMAIFYGAIWPMYGACAGDYFPRDVMGTVIGAWTPLYGFGAIMVHWVSGMLRDATGAYDHSFIICSGMAGVAILFMSMVKRGDSPRPLKTS